MAQHLDEFGDLAPLVLAVARDDRMLDAMFDVVLEDLVLELLERGLDRLDLVHHVDAVAVFGDHARDAAHLAFDAAQSRGGGFLDGVSHGLHTIPL